MSPGTIALIIVALSIGGWALFMANVTIRKHREGSGCRAASPRTSRPSPHVQPVPAFA